MARAATTVGGTIISSWEVLSMVSKPTANFPPRHSAVPTTRAPATALAAGFLPPLATSTLLPSLHGSDWMQEISRPFFLPLAASPLPILVLYAPVGSRPQAEREPS